MPYILKNQPVNLYVLLKPGFEGPLKFTLTYRDSATKDTLKTDLSLKGDEPVFAFIDKMAHHKKITLICEAIKNKSKISSDIFMSETGDLKI
jgi:hypothetical protein